MAVTSNLPRELQAADLAIEIADEYARADIECKAMRVPSNHPLPVYDTSELEGWPADLEIQQAHQQDVARAVRYLDLRGLLVRPFKDSPQLVGFQEAA
jgi:hypothetical protein